MGRPATSRSGRRAMVAVAGLLGLGGCQPAERVGSHAAWQAEATRQWPGETRARVIAAGEAVLRHAAGRDLAFEYRPNGFLARRRFQIFAVIAAVEGEDRWSFTVGENAVGASASLRLVSRGTAQGGTQRQGFRDWVAETGTFRLFYARVDYLLGRRAEWVSCAEAPAVLGVSAAAPGTEALCGITLAGRAAPPPAQLPRLEARPRSGPLPPPPETPDGAD